jgi:RimJ/RimL family protein N-acetyltransferase
VIETERLLLRKPFPDDADGAYELISDPEVMRFIGQGRTGDRRVARGAVARWIERWDVNGFGHFAIVRREDERFLGRAGLLVWDAATWQTSDLRTAAEPIVELGWALVRAFWGNGYATEAAGAVRAWAAAEHGLGPLISIINRENVRSIGVAERLGAVREREIQIDNGTADVWRHPLGGQPPAR